MPVIEIDDCKKCPHHVTVSDPDPSDWFNDDDVTVLCKLQDSEKADFTHRSSGRSFPHKIIASACRPYESIAVPSWCPLEKKDS